MRIISYINNVSVDGARIAYRNPRWYQKPESGFSYVIAKEAHILEDYRNKGIPTYEIQKEERKQEETKVDVDSLTWNELRKKAKEITGEPVKNKEEAIKILEQYF